jgi:hypothetical protein
VCVGAKANVLHCVVFERWDAALLILQKRWLLSFIFSVRFLSVVSFFTLSDNVLALGAVADFGAQNCQYTTNVDAR